MNHSQAQGNAAPRQWLPALKQSQVWLWTAVTAALISCSFLLMLYQSQRVDLNVAYGTLENDYTLEERRQHGQLLDLIKESQKDFITALLGTGGLLFTLSFGIFVAYRDEWRSREQSARAEAALRQNEQQLQNLGDNLPQSYVCRYRYDQDGRRSFLYLSAGARQIHGLEIRQIVESPQLLFNQIDPEQGRAFQQAERAARQAMADFSFEFRCLRPDGEQRWLQLRSRPIRTPDGDVVWDGVATDVTDRKVLEEQFLRAQRMEAIGTLAGGVAHDLNNILAPVMMISGLLRTRTTDSADLRIIDLLENSVQRGANIIRQLLAFSRGANGERVQVQLRHLVKETADLLRETFPRSITVEDNCAADLSLVEGDPTQLHQVLMNLCVNARDAMPDGGELRLSAGNVDIEQEAPQLHARAKPGHYLLLTVADTGEGMTPEQLQRIFDPFFTTKAPGKGTGLGLSSVLGIVKGHGGFVTVDSTPGKGSSFKVYLPAKRESVKAPAAVSGPVLARGNGETILLVDDESSILESTSMVLEDQGYRVLTASNGKEALELAKRHAQELRVVVTDLMMPVMSGTELIHHLHLQLPKLPIIAVTGLDLEVDKEALAAASVSDLLLKPLTPAALLMKIEQKLKAY